MRKRTDTVMKTVIVLRPEARHITRDRRQDLQDRPDDGERVKNFSTGGKDFSNIYEAVAWEQLLLCDGEPRKGGCPHSECHGNWLKDRETLLGAQAGADIQELGKHTHHCRRQAG